MKSTLKAFGATFDQVCSLVRETIGEHGLLNGAQEISSALAVSTAADRFRGVASGKWMLASVFAAATVLSHPPAMAQNTSGDGRTEGNTSARVVGGMGGAILGAVLTRGSSSLGQAAAIVGLGYVGQSLGDMATRKVTDQKGNPVVQTGTDAQGRPIYQSASSLITQNAYTAAIQKASSPYPAVDTIGPNGVHLRVLDKDSHVGLYSLMVETIANRALAKLAVNELDKTEVARAIAPNDPKRSADFSMANQTYTQLFNSYATSFQQTSQAIFIAKRNGFDVSSQELLMSVVPGDLRANINAPLHWPGVDDRIRVLGAKMNLDHTATYAELYSMNEHPTHVLRQRE